MLKISESAKSRAKRISLWDSPKSIYLRRTFHYTYFRNMGMNLTHNCFILLYSVYVFGQLTVIVTTNATLRNNVNVNVNKA